jgi:hypothetical protein
MGKSLTAQPRGTFRNLAAFEQSGAFPEDGETPSKLLKGDGTESQLSFTATKVFVDEVEVETVEGAQAKADAAQAAAEATASADATAKAAAAQAAAEATAAADATTKANAAQAASARVIEPKVVDFTAIVGGRYVTSGGLLVADPTTRPDGSPLVENDSYEVWIGDGTVQFDGVGLAYAASRFSILRRYDGSGWGHAVPTLSDNLKLAGYTEGVVAIGNSGSSQTLSVALGTFQTVTLTANCTFTMPPAVAGKSFVLKVMTGTGGNTASFIGVRWPENTAPVITAVSGRYDLISFLADGSAWSGSAVQNFQ